jgi:hypothetical protein
MDSKKFSKWVDDVRSKVKQVWDETGVPPLSGRTEEEMVEEFKELSAYPVAKMQRLDELDGQSNVIFNSQTGVGSAVNQFFPTMMKAAINYNTSLDGDKFSGYSVYDLFAEDRFKNRCHLGFARHFRRDSFYKYSQSVERNSLDNPIRAASGKEWVEHFYQYRNLTEGYNFWLCPLSEKSIGKRTGYTEIDTDKFLWLSKSEVEDVKHLLEPHVLANVKELKDDIQYHIRYYRCDSRIFPDGFTAFKIGYIQIAVNFPPLIAKFLYEKYTEHIKDQKVINIYDPSSGWGGRISGAMCVKDDRRIHYIGTDPNTDNQLPEINTSRYGYVADFINKSLTKGNLVKWMKGTHSYQVFCSGSECVHEIPEFQKFKGELDFIFTSPPYFNREGYSDDPTQSLKKFPQYNSWRDGFLVPTLTTCVEYLKPGRYLLWNIADIKVGKNYYPLEEDSNKVLRDLGMQFIGIEKMRLASMPGANRIGADGKPTAKNYMKVNGRWEKYEPIFVWYKPA